VRREQGDDFYHKIVLDDGKLTGAILVGAFQNEGFYLNLMQRQLAVAPFADTLLRGTCSYPRWLAQDSRGKFGLKRLEVVVHP